MEQNEENTGQSGWQEQDTHNFLAYGQFFVPERQAQIETVRDLIVPPEGVFEVLDLACGAGLLAEAILEKHQQAIVYGYDASPQMIEHAQQRLARFGERFRAGLFELDSEGWRRPGFPVQVVVSSLAVHHLDHDQKQRLYSDLQKLLQAGGQLVIADLVLAPGQNGLELAASQWDASVQRQAEAAGEASPESKDAWQVFEQQQWNVFRYPEDPLDKPAPLFDQLIWLEQAGFVEVDVYWMKAGHSIFGGRAAS